MPSSGIDPGRIVLDTSAYSQLRRGHSEMLDRLAAAQVILLPVTVLGELEGGFAGGGRAQENRVALNEFLREPFVAILDTTAEVARRYGLLFARLRRAGTPIPVNDIWIAAATLDCGGHLLSFDRDFDHIEELDCTVLAV